MNIYINIKAAGKRRPILDKVPYELPDGILSLRELLTELVRIEVDRYNQKGTDIQMIPFLTAEEVQESASVGKVGFGRIYSDKKVDIDKAVANAIQCYEDGVVRVFLNEAELEQLDEEINLHEEDCLTLIRLTFLAGRMW